MDSWATGRATTTSGVAKTPSLCENSTQTFLTSALWGFQIIQDYQYNYQKQSIYRQSASAIILQLKLCFMQRIQGENIRITEHLRCNMGTRTVRIRT